MGSFHTITIFTEEPISAQGLSSFAISLIVHGALVGFVPFWMIHSPHIREHILPERYTVRHLEMNIQAPVQRAGGKAIPYPHPAPADPKNSSEGGSAVPPSPMARQLAHLQVGAQTLVQPDIPTKVKLDQEIPVPAVVLWTPGPPPAKTIVAPQPQEATASDVQPSPVAPNQEKKLADTAVSASAVESKLPVLPPSTTSPVVAPNQKLAQKAPETSSNSAEKPTPTAVLSLSTLKMAQGTVMLPPVNETASANAPGVGAPGQSKPSPSAHGNKPSGSAAGTGSGQAPGKDEAKKPSGSTQEAQNNQSASHSQSQKTAIEPESGAPSTTIRLPKDGHFGVVVVGSSLEESYPQTAGFWSGRLAYTVYLHVGMAKSWILQYSLPRTVDAEASGSSIRPDAPWPFTIVRPDLSPDDIDADVLMVHGLINKAGQFEALSVVFPPHFAKEGSVLSALRKWEFRPAKQNGQLIDVEVLLIAPEEPE
jgi:hypothetical protein